MKPISNRELFELLVDTAERCSSTILPLDDDDFEYNIFEEFEVGILSFFHDENLDRLFHAGLISSDAAVLSREIRMEGLAFVDDHRSETGLRGNLNFRRLMQKCDRLLELFASHRSAG